METIKLSHKEIQFWQNIYSIALESFLNQNATMLAAFDDEGINAEDFATRWADNSIIYLRARVGK